MSATWDREPLWEGVSATLARNGSMTASDITTALIAEGWGAEPVGYKLAGRVYQLLHEKIVTGEVVARTIPGRRAKTYTLSTEMPQITVRFTGEEYASLWKIARRLRRSPEETARRLMLAGIEYMQGVIR